jgi:hypothetical protein
MTNSDTTHQTWSVRPNRCAAIRPAVGSATVNAFTNCADSKIVATFGLCYTAKLEDTVGQHYTAGLYCIVGRYHTVGLRGIGGPSFGVPPTLQLDVLYSVSKSDLGAPGREAFNGRSPADLKGAAIVHMSVVSPLQSLRCHLAKICTPASYRNFAPMAKSRVLCVCL